MIWRNATTICQISETALTFFRLRALLLSKREEIIYVRTVDSFKAKLKKLGSVVSLLTNNKQQQSQFLKKMIFVVTRFCHITADL